MSRRLLGERVVVKVLSCPPRDGVLISGVKKPSKEIQKFPVRFPNGDVRTYRGDQLLLRGSQAPLLEYIRVGDIIFTKKTLGVVRFIGLHEDYVGTVIVLEPIDPKLPSDPDVTSFRKLFPSANLADSRAYNIVRGVDEILKVLPPDALLQQLSKMKDKYIAFVEDSSEKDRAFDEDMSQRTRKIAQLETEIKEQEKEINSSNKELDTENNDEVDEVIADTRTTQIVFKPGRLGIKAIWKSGEVEGVSANEQAEKLGVQVGWTIVKIDDDDYSEAKLDLKAGGKTEYTLTFSTERPEHPNPKPVPNDIKKDAVKMLTTETEKEKFERKIHELNDQIEDYQYTVESLQAKNKNMEEEHKNLPKLRTKVDQLRNSKGMFINQIKEVQKREKMWKQKAEENEQKYKKLLMELKSVESPQSVTVEDSSKKERSVGGPGNKPKQFGGRHVRKGSVQMPQPEAANTLSIGSQPSPAPHALQVGDGSAQTFSMSSLNKNSDGNNSSGKDKRNKATEKRRFPRW